MQNILRTFAQTWAHQIVTTEKFQEFLETTTGENLDAYFNRYVYGGNAPSDQLSGLRLHEDPSAVEQQANGGYGRHPRPLTRADVLNLR